MQERLTSVKIVKVIDKVERVMISILFTVMVLAVFGQVLNRNLFKLNISWFEELARGCMIYMLMLGTELSFRDHSQLNVDSLVRRLPSKVKVWFDYFSTLMIIVFSGVVGFASIRMIRSMMTVGGVMPALQIPKYYFAGCVTIGCLAIFLTQTIILINSIVKLCMKKTENGEEQNA